MANKEWFFSGLGIFIIGVIFTLFKRNNGADINSLATNTNNININWGPNKKQAKNNDNDQINKANTQILFIDDEKFKTVENLKSAGWVNTKTIKDVSNLDCPDVKNSHIIFVDINGVGEKLFPTDKGLGLAEALKKKYPKKYIVIYSAQEQGDRFQKALKIVDFSLSKNAEPYEFVNILENFRK